MIQGNKSNLTLKEIERADKAVDLQRKLGSPRYAKFFKVLERNQLCNCPITVNDKKRALHIYGTDEVMLKGKTTLRKSYRMEEARIMPISGTITDLHKQVVLSGDYLYVQGIPILHTLSNNYIFRTVFTNHWSHRNPFIRKHTWLIVLHVTGNWTDHPQKTMYRNESVTGGNRQGGTHSQHRKSTNNSGQFRIYH